MLLSSSKAIKKQNKKMLTPAEKIDHQLDYLELQFAQHISALEKLEQDISQENYTDPQYLEQKYKSRLQKLFEIYRRLSKKVNSLQWKSILQKDQF